MVPDDLHDAGEAWRRTCEVRDFVDDDDERLLTCECRHKAERGFPIRETAARQIHRVGAEVALDRAVEPPELDRLGLLGAERVVRSSRYRGTSGRTFR